MDDIEILKEAGRRVMLRRRPTVEEVRTWIMAGALPRTEAEVEKALDEIWCEIEAEEALIRKEV